MSKTSSGFFVTPNTALKVEATPNERLVLLVLFSFCNRYQNKCWPSQAVLCKITGLSVTAVRDSLRSLIDRGYISIESVSKSDGQKCNIYVISELLFWTETEGADYE